MANRTAKPGPSEKTIFRRKVAAAAALVVIFGVVVFSVPADKLAWQGAYVMGTLLLPTPSQHSYVRPEAMRENSDSSFSLLGFFSVTGILVGLTVKQIKKKAPDGKSGRGKP
jgi:hypothetical protein